WPSGAALRLGNQVVRQGPEQQPRSLRGLSVTNRLQVLRPSGLGQGQVALDAPARLQFFDTQGQPLFSTGLLPAGRYRLEGLGAPSLPGLLTVRIEGLSGQTETILLPWVASPLLLAPGTRQWDIWIGNTAAENATSLQAEQRAASASQALAFSGLWAQGWNDTETLRIGLAHEYDVTQAYAGVSSQRWQGLLVSADLGLACRGQRCLPTGGLDISGQPRSGLQWSAGLRRQLQHASALPSLAEPELDPLTNTALRIGHTLRLSASQRLRPGTTLTSQLSLGEGRLALLGLQLRINNRTSLQASLRTGYTSPDAKSQTSAFISLHVALPDRPSATSPTGSTGSTGSAGSPGAPLGYHIRRRLSAGLQSDSGGNSGASISYQQSLGNTASAPQIGLTKASGGNARDELRLQQAASWGDISLQARQPQGQQASVDLSLASRLWLTAKGMHLGPVGDHNLVIHSLGHPDLRLQLGRQTAATNAKGIAAFGRTPAWTEAQFRLDTQSIPFDLHWKTSQVRLPTAARRAYWIDQTQETILVQEFRLQLPAAALARLKRFETGNGQPVAFTPEGYLDIASLAQLPLTAVTHDGQRLTCHQARPSDSAQENARDPAGDAVVWIDCPGLAPEPAPRRPQIREALSEPAPSSG
ncbi:MAG: fimbria/pilus outer membrane usher protein, partial [Burkholderiaceae bacterium]